jgi:hypothetical protein
VELSGLVIETRAEQHVEVPIVTLLMPSEIRWPCVPEKVTSAFWPGTGPIETVSGDPPGVIEPVTSGGTSYKVSVAEPTSVSCGSTRIV